jgi:hypothetical protein
MNSGRQSTHSRERRDMSVREKERERERENEVLKGLPEAE